MPNCPESKNCPLFRHEGYSACKECEVAHPELNTETDPREIKRPTTTFVEPPRNSKTEMQSLDENVPPYDIDEENLRMAHSYVNKEICLPFDSENRKEFYSQFDQAILKLSSSSDRKTLVTRDQTMQTYKTLAARYPRKHYGMFETFKLISPVIENIFGYSAFCYRFSLGNQVIDGVDQEFLKQYYDRLERMPILERRELTNGYVKTLVRYTVKRDNVQLTQDELQTIVETCIGYYTACYKLGKAGNFDKARQLKPNAVVEKFIRGEQLAVPLKDERRI